MNAPPPSSSVTPASRAPDGLVLGRYRVIAKLGQGGMSEVLLASVQSARGVNKLSVIKRLRSDLSGGEGQPTLEGAAPEQPFATMFLEEARITCRLNHPSIVHTYEVGEERGRLCIVMEYIEGESLHAIVRRLAKLGRAMSPALAVRVVSEVLAGLHYAHEMRDYDGTPLGIVHRDVSPHNVMVCYQGGVKLLDFGIAKAAASEVQTEVGVLKGKVHYMAPEQAQSKGVDRRADVFSAGVVLWEALTRRRMVQGDTPVASWFSLLNDPFPRPSTLVEGLDPRLDDIVMRALERDPEARYPSALAFREALEEYAVASGEGATLEQLGRFVAELFEATRRTRAQQIRDFLAACDAGPAGSPPSPAEFASEPGLLLADGTPSGATPPLLSAAMAADSAAARATRPPPAGRRRFGFALVAAGAAAALAGVYAFERIGLPRAGRGASGVEVAPAAAPTPRGPALPPAPPPPPDRPAAVAPSAPAIAAEPEPAPKERAEPARPRPVAVAPRPQPPPRPAPPPPAPKAVELPSSSDEPTANGFLTLDTYPWTRVTENGRALGTTPLVRVPLAPGVHTLTLENAAEGVKKTTTVTVKSGENVSRRLAFQ